MLLLFIQDSCDTHDPSRTPIFTHTYMMQPSAVQEMALHNRLLFVLLQSGLCPVFETRGGCKAFFVVGGRVLGALLQSRLSGLV